MNVNDLVTQLQELQEKGYGGLQVRVYADHWMNFKENNMSKIKQARDLLESIGVEFYATQEGVIEQAIKVEQTLSKQQEFKVTYWGGSSDPFFKTEAQDD